MPLIYLSTVLFHKSTPTVGNRNLGVGAGAGQFIGESEICNGKGM